MRSVVRFLTKRWSPPIKDSKDMIKWVEQRKRKNKMETKFSFKPNIIPFLNKQWIYSNKDFEDIITQIKQRKNKMEIKSSFKQKIASIASFLTKQWTPSVKDSKHMIRWSEQRNSKMETKFSFKRMIVPFKNLVSWIFDKTSGIAVRELVMAVIRNANKWKKLKHDKESNHNSLEGSFTKEEMCTSDGQKFQFILVQYPEQTSITEITEEYFKDFLEKVKRHPIITTAIASALPIVFTIGDACMIGCILNETFITEHNELLKNTKEAIESNYGSEVIESFARNYFLLQNVKLEYVDKDTTLQLDKDNIKKFCIKIVESKTAQRMVVRLLIIYFFPPMSYPF